MRVPSTSDQGFRRPSTHSTNRISFAGHEHLNMVPKQPIEVKHDYACAYCESTYFKDVHLAKHIDKRHSSVNAGGKCSACGSTFRLKDDLLDHLILEECSARARGMVKVEEIREDRRQSVRSMQIDTEKAAPQGLSSPLTPVSKSSSPISSLSSRSSMDGDMQRTFSRDIKKEEDDFAERGVLTRIARTFTGRESGLARRRTTAGFARRQSFKEKLADGVANVERYKLGRAGIAIAGQLMKVGRQSRKQVELKLGLPEADHKHGTRGKSHGEGRSRTDDSDPLDGRLACPFAKGQPWRYPQCILIRRVNLPGVRYFALSFI
jgi:hypothetical protein